MSSARPVRVAIITYSTYGHVNVLAKAIQKGVQDANGHADLFSVEETLDPEALRNMNVPTDVEKFPLATKETLEQYDAFLFGIPTRFGNVPAQWSAFWDQTGQLWVTGALNGKIAGMFVSSAGYGGGQEVTIKACLNYLVHHGMIYVPLGYRDVFGHLASLEEIHGGSPWGAGTLAGADGTRIASETEIKIAEVQGKTFFMTANKIMGGGSLASSTTAGNEPTATKNTVTKTVGTGDASVPAAGTTPTAPKSAANFGTIHDRANVNKSKIRSSSAGGGTEQNKVDPPEKKSKKFGADCCSLM